MNTIKAFFLALLTGTALLAQTITLQPNASPTAAQPGASVTVTGSGFPTGTIDPTQVLVALTPVTANAGPAQTFAATSITLVTGTTRRVAFVVPSTLTVATPTTYSVKVSSTATGVAFQSANFAALTVNPPPAITSVTPNSAAQGQTVSVQVTGNNYDGFVQGATVASFGPGIAVGGASAGTPGPATVTGTNTLTATLAIDPAATLGGRTVTVQTGTAQATLANGFTVTASAPQPTVVTLNSPAVPSSASPGAQVSVSGSGFPSGAINTSDAQVLLEPAQPNGGPTLRIVPASITPSSGATRTVTFSIPANLSVQSPASYLISVTGKSGTTPFSSANKVALTIAPAATAPSITSILPTSAAQGQTVTLSITGQNTHFAANTTVNLGAGTTSSNVTAASPTSLTAAIAIDPNAAVGTRTLVVATGSEVVSLTNGFQVTAATITSPAVITSVTPSVGNTGTSVTLTITGANTNFKQGVTTVSLGEGITIGAPTVSSPTTLTVLANIVSSATPGPRPITVTTGTELATLSNAFSVVGPQITITTPTNLLFTNTPSITVSGTVNVPAATVTVNGVNAPNAGGSFTTAVPLSEGNNTLTAVATSPGGATATASVLVTLDTTPPHLAILSPPADLDTMDAAVNVSGMVNDIVVGTVNDQQAQVTVNGIQAQVSNRSFLAMNVPLNLGANTIQVVAKDRVGNAATASITINRVASVQIRTVSGNAQSGPIQTALGNPLTVEVHDALGNLVPNQTIVFKVTGNDGSMSAIPGAASGKPSVIVTTNALGRAQAYWTLGSRSGAGGNRAEATTPGVAGAAVFTATGLSAAPAQIVVDSGLNQSGAAGDLLPLPFVAVVTDAGHNRLAGVPVTFTVTQGGGSVNGAPSITLISDGDGRVAVTPRLGPGDGIANNAVVASFAGNAGSSAVFTATGRVAGPPSQTVVSGVVLDNSNSPIRGVTVRLLQLNQGSASNLPKAVAGPVVSDSQGQFAMPGAPVGVFKLLADGTTAGAYPTLEFDITTVAGQNNTIGMPIFLPVLDQVNKLCVDSKTGGTLTLPSSPGFSLTVAPGSATFPGGSKTGCISVTPVNMDKSPMTPGFGQQPRFLVTVQPVGATFSPPARIAMPNFDGLRPNSVTEMYSYDHDLASFVSIGTGTVSTDGSVIRSDPGVGVIKAGWHCGGDPSAIGTVADCPTCKLCKIDRDGTPRCLPDPAQDKKNCDASNKCKVCTAVSGQNGIGDVGCCIDLSKVGKPKPYVVKHDLLTGPSYGAVYYVAVPPFDCDLSDVHFFEVIDIAPGGPTTACFATPPDFETQSEDGTLAGHGFKDKISSPLPQNLPVGQSCAFSNHQVMNVWTNCAGIITHDILFDQQIVRLWQRLSPPQGAASAYKLTTIYLGSSVTQVITFAADGTVSIAEQ